MTRRPIVFAFVSIASLGSLANGLAACGGRTGLLESYEISPIQQPDAAAPVGADASLLDSGASFDSAAPVFDSAAPVDAAAPTDALPPLRVTPPSALPVGCADSTTTLIYLITEADDLMSFNPSTNAFQMIGRIVCPTVNLVIDPVTGRLEFVTPTPFSMAVDKTGIAYIIFNDGELFRVGVATAACEATPFQAPDGGAFTSRFGMGYSENAQGTAETLYVASNSQDPGDPPPSLGTIDTNTFALRVIGKFSPPINLNSELTGTGAGDLFGFYSTDDAGSSAIAQIDKASGKLTGQANLPGIAQGYGWAFAFWGGDFYTFTAPDPSKTTVVTRYRPTDGSITQVASTSELVVGAGVSTCAPQQQNNVPR